jgi:hypothetical protein
LHEQVSSNPKIFVYVQHSLEVESSGGQHHVDCVAEVTLVEVARQSVIPLKMSDDRLGGGTSAAGFLTLLLFMAGQVL